MSSPSLWRSRTATSSPRRSVSCSRRLALRRPRSTVRKLLSQTLKKSKLKYLDVSQNENILDFPSEVAEVKKKVSVVKATFVKYHYYLDDSDDNNYSYDDNYSDDFDNR